MCEELTLSAADGTAVPIYLSLSRLSVEGTPDSYCAVATDLSRQKRNEAMLAEERLSRAVLEQAADVIVICDGTGMIKQASKKARSFHSTHIPGQMFDEIFPLKQPDGSPFPSISSMNRNFPHPEEVTLESRGRIFNFLVSVGHLTGTKNELLGSVVTMTDMTVRKLAEARIASLNRVYAVLSGINSLIVRARDRAELFSGTGRIAVREGGFLMAMLCTLEPDTNRIVPIVPPVGDDSKLLAKIYNLLNSGGQLSSTMIARAMGEKTVIISNDSVNDPLVPAGRKLADYGIRSLIVLPLIVAGWLSICEVQGQGDTSWL